jgi:hypothetical protein
MEKSAAATTAGADDAMLARREKAIFGFLENKLQKTLYAQRKSATAVANKAAYNEGQTKQFYKKYRPSLKTGDISSLHTTPDWDDPETKKEHQARRKTWVKRRRITTYGSFKKDRRRTLNQYSKSSEKEN